MNRKLLVSFLFGLIVLVALFFIFNNYIYQEKQTTVEEGAVTTFTGEVIAIDMSQTSIDGPVILTLEASDGTLTNVAIPTEGFENCPAAPNIANVYALADGDIVEVRGERSTSGSIAPCANTDDYLKVVE